MFLRTGNREMFTGDITGSSSNLSSRAWVLQESILSPRTLHYGKQQMVWECSRSTLSECSIVSSLENDRYLTPGSFWSYKTLLPQESAGTDVDRRGSLYNTWLQIFVNFTQRNLTVSTDIFPALAGIASIFQARLGDRYLAGLFEGDFLKGLLWQTIHPSTSTPTSASLAPSWSWASVGGGVQSGVNVNSSMIAPQIIGTSGARISTAETYMPDGNVASANYFLNASRGMLKVEGYSSHRRSLKETGYELDFLNSIKGDPMHPNSIYGLDVSVQLDRNEDLEKQQDVSVLHLGVWEWDFRLTRPHYKRVETTLAGLVLRKIGDPDHKIYHRIGIATLSVRMETNSPNYRFYEDAERLIAGKWSKEIFTVV
ncbi:MAG: hypothetical protein Q9170_001453 [Blastenia crenularia]